MKKITAFFTIIILLTALTGCFAEKHGNDLTGLISRINEGYGQVIVKPEGFSLGEDEKSLYGFISDGESDFLLSVDLDEKQRLTACHITFDSIGTANSESVRTFLPILFSSFTGESEEMTVSTLDSLTALSSEKAFLTENIVESERAKYTYTATSAGVVISCELIKSYGTSALVSELSSNSPSELTTPAQ